MPANEGLSLILARSKSGVMPEILPTAGDRTTRNCSIRHFLIALQKQKRHNAAGETMRGIIAANLSKAGWSWGCLTAVDRGGRTIFVADAHRDDSQRFIVRADEKLTAFVELESEISAVRIPHR